MNILKANSTDSSFLTALIRRSKNHWGYGEKQIEIWKDELNISETYILKHHVYKLVENNSLKGFYGFHAVSVKMVKLEFLFIEPKFIGLGHGKRLLNHFLETIKKLGYLTATLDSDPNAVDFYLKNGFKIVGELKSSIKDRFLPIMELKVKKE